jgi:hypothetical protein
MRSLLALLAVASLAASLSGCASPDPEPLPPEPAEEGFDDALFQGTPDQGAPAGDASGHGEPRREDGPVEAGMTPPLQFPGMFWARQLVTISNGFGGAALGHAFFGIDAGHVSIETAEGDGYSIEILSESYGMTEQEARDALGRVEVAHTDDLQADGLHLSTVVRQADPSSPLPFVFVGSSHAWVEVRVTLPESPAYELSADASSGEVSVSGVRGPSIQLTTSSGDVLVDRVHAGTLSVETSSGNVELDTVQADDLQASASSGDVTGAALRVGKALVDTSSGGIDLQGAIDTLEADASSGGIALDAYARRTGAYRLATSSGDVEVLLLPGDGRAYHVRAEADAGEVTVDLPDSETRDEDDDRAEVVSSGFDAAAIQTVLDIETSSGDIDVAASGDGRGDRGDGGDEGDGHDHDGHA